MAAGFQGSPVPGSDNVHDGQGNATEVVEGNATDLVVEQTKNHVYYYYPPMPLPLQRTNGLVDHNATATRTSPYLIEIKRTSHPVKQKGKVVSMKSSYKGTISIGGTGFEVIFDTGSGHVVIPSVACESETCMTHKRYNASASGGKWVSTHGKIVDGPIGWGQATDQVTIGYGTGQVSGNLVREKICVRGKDGMEACVKMHAVAAYEMSPIPFQQLRVDGIVGMGLQELTVHDTFSFFDALLYNNVVCEPRFSFFLTDGEHGQSSELALGGHNPSRLLNPDAPFNWAPVELKGNSGHWMVRISGVFIGGQKISMCEGDDECHGIVDSGTSHLGVPGDHFGEIESLLTTPAGDLLDCRLASSPEVSIEIAGFNITLSAKTYMRQLPIRDDVNVTTNSRLSHADLGTSQAVLPGTEINDEGETGVAATNIVPRRCIPRLLPVRVGPPLGPNLFMLGEPVMKEYYTSFDWHLPAVGFAKSVHSLVQPAKGSNGFGQLPDNMEVYLMQQRLNGKVSGVDGEEDEMYMLQVVVSVTVRQTTRQAGHRNLIY